MAELRRLARLARLTREAGERAGLSLRWWAVVPDVESDAAPVNRLRILFLVEPSFGMDPELAALEKAASAPTHDPEEAQRRRTAAAEEAAALARRLNDPHGGIL